MKNGIKVTARLVKQLAENQQDLVWEAYGMLRAELRNCSWSFDFPCFPGGGCFFRP